MKKLYVLIYIEFSHIFSVNIVNFDIKMLPIGGLRGTKVLAPHL